MLLNLSIQIRFIPSYTSTLKEIKESKNLASWKWLLNILPSCVLASVSFHQKQNNLFVKLQEEEILKEKKKVMFP